MTKSSEALLPVVYDELRHLARKFFADQPPGHTLQPTALVNEAYMRLAQHDEVLRQSRTHFFNLAARAMRQVLVDHARRRGAKKRGGGLPRVTLSEAAVTPERDADCEALVEALEHLGQLNRRHLDVVLLRFFGGLTVEEVAVELEVSTRTVEDDWRLARAWLLLELGETP